MSKKKLLIIYAGHTDNDSTATIAQWIAAGASKYVTVVVKKASDVKIKDVADANGYALGSGVYNGNPGPDMIDFSENVLDAGKNKDALNLSDRFVGTFCTSAGYTTGAQPVLNAMARILMTFGASYIVGGNWHSGQGICGMVADTAT
jgi:multimeric flavodoxin WrbA